MIKRACNAASNAMLYAGILVRRPHPPRRRQFIAATLGFAALLGVLGGCEAPGRRTELMKKNDTLLHQNRRLARTVEQRNATIAELDKRVANLEHFSSDQPPDLFAPVRIEIASLSGGADFDGKPGDDGITVYLRPKDADGDIVKVPGSIKVQLIDNSDLGNPRILGVYEFGKPEELRKLWNSHFVTDHYALKCPFRDNIPLPESRRVTVSVVFVDFLTGKTLTAVKEVAISY